MHISQNASMLAHTGVGLNVRLLSQVVPEFVYSILVTSSCVFSERKYTPLLAESLRILVQVNHCTFKVASSRIVCVALLCHDISYV